MAENVRVQVTKRHTNGKLDADVEVSPIPLGNEDVTRALAHVGGRDQYEIEIVMHSVGTGRETRVHVSREEWARLNRSDSAKRTSMRNRITIANLTPGRYTVRYRVKRAVRGKIEQIDSEAKSLNIA